MRPRPEREISPLESMNARLLSAWRLKTITQYEIWSTRFRNRIDAVLRSVVDSQHGRTLVRTKESPGESFNGVRAGIVFI